MRVPVSAPERVSRNSDSAGAAEASPKKSRRQLSDEYLPGDHGFQSSTGPEKLRAEEGPSQDATPMHIELATGSRDNTHTELFKVGLSLLRSQKPRRKTCLRKS